MVHALDEIRRVLARNGILIDLRPLADRSPVEVVSASETRRAGLVDQLPEDVAKDETANRSIAQVEKRNWFTREREEFFPFNYYWDSPKEMQEYIEGEWADFITIDEKVLQNARSMWSVANADARVRMPLKMLITRWRKQENMAGE
jgi:hypothetical protein